MVHDMPTADSITADALSRGFQFADRDHPRNPVAWVRSIACNLARHWLRDRKKHDEILERIGPPRDTRSAADEVLGIEALTMLKGEIDRLSNKQRRALLYRMVDRMPYEQISEIMGLKPGAIRALVLRARLRLMGWRDYMNA